MLKKLTIEQFVIIDRLELEFKPGLTVLTGETGAGKSILLDATGLILGDPSAPESVRAGSMSSLIEAVFETPSDNPLWKFLKGKGVVSAPQPQFTIRREINLQGEDVIRFNDKDVPLDLLQEIGTYLCEIHGQFANQTMLAPDNQLKLLDLSGNFPPEIFKNVADALQEVHRYTKELEEENSFLASHKREFPKIEEVVRRFDSVGMRENFVEDVTVEHARLLIAKETSQAFQDIFAQLIAANGVVMTLTSAHTILTRNPNLEAEKMVDLEAYLSNSLENARGAVVEMRRLAPEYEIDTEPLHKLTEIIEVLKKISRDSKVNYEDLQDFYAVMSTKLARLRNGRERIAELQDLLIKAKNNYRHHAHILHEKRVIAGNELSAAITAELAPLKLNRAEFKVVVEERANMTWTPLGLDHVTFTARMNPGQPFSPVSDTASGGELARLILALKVVLQQVQTIPTLVFDEVDTGIGGSAAAAVGERIAKLADKTQVLVITHSPQVASRNDHHLHVSKSTDGITTKSNVRMLTIEESTDEISRMLAGDTITPESLAAARSLIGEAKAAAEVRRKAG